MFVFVSILGTKKNGPPFPDLGNSRVVKEGSLLCKVIQIDGKVRAFENVIPPSPFCRHYHGLRLLNNNAYPVLNVLNNRFHFDILRFTASTTSALKIDALIDVFFTLFISVSIVMHDVRSLLISAFGYLRRAVHSNRRRVMIVVRPTRL